MEVWKAWSNLLYALYLKSQNLNLLIETTHCATSLVNGEYNSVGFIPISQFYLSNYSIELD